MSRVWMLDTNTVSYAFRDSGGPVATRLRATAAGECCLSIVSLAELRFGAVKVGSDRILRQIDGFLAVAPALPFDHPAEITYAEVRAELEREGRLIGPLDLLIASHALSLDLTLVTANVREFSRVPGLKVENWLD